MTLLARVAAAAAAAAAALLRGRQHLLRASVGVSQVEASSRARGLLLEEEAAAAAVAVAAAAAAADASLIKGWAARGSHPEHYGGGRRSTSLTGAATMLKSSRICATCRDPYCRVLRRRLPMIISP